jgi:hypothetical protein
MEYADIPFNDSKYLSSIMDYFHGRGFLNGEVNGFQFFTDKDNIHCVATISIRKPKSILRISTYLPEFDKRKIELTKLVQSE